MVAMKPGYARRPFPTHSRTDDPAGHSMCAMAAIPPVPSSFPRGADSIGAPRREESLAAA